MISIKSINKVTIYTVLIIIIFTIVLYFRNNYLNRERFLDSTNDGESHSAASVRESLKKLISTEPLNSPFSDEALVTKLQTEGINLARRTVAKYRELMNIPSSSIRRRMMKIQSLNI